MGRFLHRNYSGYLVPTNADIPELEVIFAGEFDPEASPLGTKGMGELTAVAVALRSSTPSIMRRESAFVICRSR